MRYNPEGFYTSELLEQHGLTHGFGTRHFDPAVITKNGVSSVRPELVEGLTSHASTGSARTNVFIPKTKQIHSNTVTFFRSAVIPRCAPNPPPKHIITGDPSSVLPPQDDKRDKTFIGDAWLTDVPGIVCLVRTADCLPILIYDPRNKIVGAIHAGWRGTAAHIVRETLSKLFTMGSRPEDIVAVLGPRIMGNCYTVGDDVMAEFAKNGWDLVDGGKGKGISPFNRISPFNGTGPFVVSLSNHERKNTLSLSAAVRHELAECGIKPKNIDSINLCTFCETDKFHSYRKAPREEGRQVNFISL